MATLRFSGGDKVFLVHGTRETDDFVLQYRKIFVAPIDNGQWLNYDDLTYQPWSRIDHTLDPITLHDLLQTVRHCYCDQMPGSTCDFCAGIRTPGDK